MRTLDFRGFSGARLVGEGTLTSMGLEAIHEAAAERVGPGAGYAGEVTPEEAWRLLNEDPNAVLVDVRTQPEWMFVGVPDLSGVAAELVVVEWQVFPAMRENPNFAEEVAARGVTPEATAIFICRSGNRSADTARVMTAAGVERCYNLIDGFEGGLDSNRQRGTLGGWKAKGLPWVQG